jgi:dihydrofolate synthase / folylpolyglutamate synthase
VYTSPHYKDFRERIKINGTYISRKYIIDFVSKYRSVFDEVKPSFFEMTVALAFAYFRDQKVDVAVIETGLGGRLDSTNNIKPLLSVITNISMDHQSMLGNTLSEIAGEKAGIIKSGIPVIIGETQEEIAHVFKNKAKDVGSPIDFADQQSSLTKSGEKYTFSVGEISFLSGFTTSLVGPFQEKNLLTALYSMQCLKDHFDIDMHKVKAFLPDLSRHTGYIGRWQILSKSPLTIADSAHNEGGLRIIVNELAKASFRRLHMVMGFVNDKDISTIINMLPKEAQYYFAKANIPRGMPANILLEQANSIGLKGNTYRSVRQAYAAARMSAQTDDLIYIGGSIFVVAEVL